MPRFLTMVSSVYQTASCCFFGIHQPHRLRVRDFSSPREKSKMAFIQSKVWDNLPTRSLRTSTLWQKQLKRIGGSGTKCLENPWR